MKFVHHETTNATYNKYTIPIDRDEAVRELEEVT
jgi:hypothetical protein